jgi:hypothetical protein
VPSFNPHKSKNVSTITKISDGLWKMMCNLSPDEKPNSTIGHPVVPFRKVLGGIFYMFLEPVASGRCFPKNMVLGLHVTADFSNGLKWIYSKRYG